MSNTSVEEKDLPQEEMVLLNAPTTLEEAIKRIFELEMRLEDLARAAEIVEITRQFELFEGFRTAANETLVTKIVRQQPSAEDFKLTVITDEKEEDVKA